MGRKGQARTVNGTLTSAQPMALKWRLFIAVGPASTGGPVEADAGGGDDGGNKLGAGLGGPGVREKWEGPSASMASFRCGRLMSTE